MENLASSAIATKIRINKNIIVNKAAETYSKLELSSLEQSFFDNMIKTLNERVSRTDFYGGISTFDITIPTVLLGSEIDNACNKLTAYLIKNNHQVEIHKSKFSSVLLHIHVNWMYFV
jgi:hypothetical protein